MDSIALYLQTTPGKPNRISRTRSPRCVYIVGYMYIYRYRFTLPMDAVACFLGNGRGVEVWGVDESILSIHTEICLILILARFVSYRCTVVEFLQQLLAGVALNLAKHIWLIEA